jgi:hypothetical protein
LIRGPTFEPEKVDIGNRSQGIMPVVTRIELLRQACRRAVASGDPIVRIDVGWLACLIVAADETWESGSLDSALRAISPLYAERDGAAISA